MEDPNRVFLPLRSNVGWFQSLDLKEDLSNRVKESILLYDELYIEDGTLTSDITEVGSLTFYHPPNTIPLEERTIEYERDLSPTKIGLEVSPMGSKVRKPIFKGDSVARFKMDYYNIFEDIVTSDYDFLNFVVLRDDNLPKKIKDEIERLNDLDQKSFQDFYPNSFLGDLVIKCLNHDLVISASLGSAVIMDSRHRDLLMKKCWHPESTVSTKPVVKHVALNQILEIRVPKFSNLSIETVLELRNDRSWCNFRDFLRDTVATIKDDPEILSDHQALENAVRSQREKALFEELERKCPTGPKLLVDLGLGALSCIPGYGLISTALGAFKSSKSYWDGKSAWFAFLLKLESASKP